MGRPQEASISFDSVRDKNIMQLRKLNTAIFPVTYQDKFYNDALNSGDFTKLGTMALPLLGFCCLRTCLCLGFRDSEGGILIFGRIVSASVCLACL